MELKKYDVVRAKFTPQKTDDLRNGAKELIGKTGEFMASWIIEDGYDYAGQWAMVPQWEYSDIFKFGWVPLCDLSGIEIMEG